MYVDLASIPLVVIYLAVMIGLLTLLRLYLDVGEIRRNRLASRKLIELATVVARQPICVIVELRRGADKLLPLLEDMRLQGYPSLEVIVVVRSSAGRMAISKLRRYRREVGFKGLKLTQLQAGEPLSASLLRKTSSQIVAVLPSGAQLSQRFFDGVAIQFLANEGRPIRLDSVMLTGKDLSSAIKAHFSVWRNWIQRLYPPATTGLQEGVVYGRQFLKDRHYQLQYKPQVSFRAAIGLVPLVSKKRLGGQRLAKLNDIAWRLIYLAGATIAIAVIFLTLETAWERWNIVVGALLTYSLAFWTIIARQRLYTWQDRLSLVLLSPFAILFVAMSALTDLAKYLVSLSRRPIIIKARQ